MSTHHFTLNGTTICKTVSAPLKLSHKKKKDSFSYGLEVTPKLKPPPLIMPAGWLVTIPTSTLTLSRKQQVWLKKFLQHSLPDLSQTKTTEQSSAT